MSVPITLNVNVTSWRRLTGPSDPKPVGIEFCAATLAFPTGTASPRGNAKAFVEITSGANLKVAKAVRLKFAFPQAGDGFPNLAAFYPVGLSYYCKDGGTNVNAALNKHGSLPKSSIRYGIDDAAQGAAFGVPFVEIENTYNDKGTSWKYTIMIQ